MRHNVIDLEGRAAKRREEQTHAWRMRLAAMGLAGACHDLLADPQDPHFQDQVRQYIRQIEGLTGVQRDEWYRDDQGFWHRL